MKSFVRISVVKIKTRRSILPAGVTCRFINPRRTRTFELMVNDGLLVLFTQITWNKYIKREKNGALQAFFVKHINKSILLSQDWRKSSCRKGGEGAYGLGKMARAKNTSSIAFGHTQKVMFYHRHGVDSCRSS
ncbi:hypothetical protein ACS0TY_015807 [Phlomoides rotata]